MFFKAIAPTCAKGISFTIKVESADDGKIAVSVIPASESGKSGFALTPKQFVATPEEFDNEFSAVMASFAASQQTLSQQLKAAELVAEEVGKAAAEAAATAAAAKPKATTSAAAKSLSQPKKSNQVPAGLLDDGDDGEGEGEGEDVKVATASPTPSAAVASSEFSIDL